MAVIEAQTAPLHDAAARSRSREQGAHVRGQGWPSSRRRAIGEHQGRFRQHDVAGTVMLGAMVLATFAETKVARSRTRAKPLLGDTRGKRQGCRHCRKHNDQNGQILGMKYIDKAQNSAINGTPTLVKSRKR